MDIGLGVVGCLILLVDNGILCSGSSAAQASIRVLGDMLVGLLGCLSTTALDGLRDVVDGVLSSDISTSKKRHVIQYMMMLTLAVSIMLLLGKLLE